MSAKTLRDLIADRRGAGRLLTISAAMVALLAVTAGAWSLWRYSRIQWARNEALPEIQRLMKAEDLWSAYRLAQRAANYIPDDPEIVLLTRDNGFSTSINTSPPGA